MVSPYQKIKSVIDKASQLPHVDKKTVEVFLRRLHEGKLIRDENPEDHFCVFFVPFYKETRQIFLGHHKKANDWIPPGGHIEQNETLIEAVKREAKEELGFEITNEKIELFNINSLDVSHPSRPCKIHHHVWYILFMNKFENFNHTQKEFYDAKWFSLKEALKRIRIPVYRKTIQKLLF